jgi:RsiW-degrading membrane proteinase PrsW (M82 family)
MTILFIFALALAPGIYWLLYFYHKDRLAPEPRSLVARTFIIGLVAAIPIAIAELLFSWLGGFLMIVAVAPILEEYGKYFSVRFTVYHHKEFDEPLDGIIYAVAAALGFASFENFLYLLHAYQVGAGELVVTSIVRAVLSVPGHALFSSMWGYAMGMGLLISDPVPRRRFIQKGVWTAIFFHALFNFSIFAGGDMGLVGAAILIIVVSMAWKAVKRRIETALEASSHIPDPSNKTPPYT